MWTFHFTTLEEYYIGSLILPPCNAVSDGSVFVTIFFIFSGIVGSEWWVQRAFDATWMNIEGIEYMTFGQVGFTVFMFLIFLSLISVFYGMIRSRSQPKETQCEYADCRHLSIQVLGVVLFSGIWLWYGYAGQEPIFAQNAQVSKELMETAATT